ncbi:MAG TPA: hypothetical protein VNE82_02620 [Candidatus Binataceae bacterium]|nr:hypothetical protein [Candidatus Binataceae bacterium]
MTNNTNQRQPDWRNRSSRRRGRQNEHAEGEYAPPKPPTMSRSRVQLATTYAPGVLFTWEGAKGICRSVPIEHEAGGLGEAVKLLVFDGIKEITSNWYARASTIRSPDPVPIELTLDDPFYNPRTFAVEPDRTAFQFNDASVMGYVPYPLLYRCAVCGHLEEFDSLEAQHRHPLPRQCNGHQARWTQVDVVYVHWSGHIEPLSPLRNNFDPTRGEVSRINQCTCGSQSFRLRNQSSVFSDWAFICEGCGHTRDLRQGDPLTWEALERQRAGGGRVYEQIEVNMLPVSYRANSAFYPQKGAFIEFRDRNVVDLLRPERQGELLRRIAQIHGFAYSSPSDAEIEAALAAASRSAEWQDYADHVEMANRAEARGQRDRAETLRREASTLKEAWYDENVIGRGQVQSRELAAAVSARNEWARRYDPLRLTIEHDRFVAEHILERRQHHEAIDVLEPDRLICDAVGDPTALDEYRQRIGSLLQRIGIQQLVLIRGLPICEFSFGFTRVSSGPVYHREFNNRRVPMPVRLNAFPEMANSKRPIYITQQKNEALYFKIDEDLIRRWLLANHVDNVPQQGEDSIGAAYLESYQDFGPFLDEFKEREGRGGTSRSLCAYVYLLLHSLAHQVMHALADVSGLDRDGLGEYLFPADLAFVVYRKGMTPDLGNISAMWRNHETDFLRRLLDARLLRCGSGSLCDTRGGACPACIMVSEVTCIAANQLLSRAALRGGPAPNWEPRENEPLVGFFDHGRLP